MYVCNFFSTFYPENEFKRLNGTSRQPPIQKEQNSDAVTAVSKWATMVTNLSVIS